MNRIALFGWVAIVLMVAIWSVIRLQSADMTITQAQQSRLQVERDLIRLSQARAQSSHLTEHRLNDSDLISRAQQALSQAGLPIQACTGVQPRPDSSRSGSSIRIQSVLMTLHHLSPADLGAWLAAWRSQGQAWQVAEVQLTRSVAETGDAIAAEDLNRYDVSVVLAAPYLSENP